MTDKEIILSLINEIKLLKEEKEELIKLKKKQQQKEKLQEERAGKIVEILNRMNDTLDEKTC
jgi:hypothetical protein